jgi:hypothetical protein
VNHLERDLKKELDALVKSDGVEKYMFTKGKNHRFIEFLHSGRWHKLAYSGTPRTEFQNNYVRQGVRRLIRSAVAA